MASTTLSVLTATLAGATITAKAALASSETMTISPTTAQGALNMGSLFVRIENQSTTAAITMSLGAGTRWSAKGLGAKSISIATATTFIVGGQDFEDARFMITAGTIVFTQSGTGPSSFEAFQYPRTSE
jgi:hypothetical protein